MKKNLLKSLFISTTLISFSSLSFMACSTKPAAGPDKTIAGTVLGAAWGAGAGAVVGNQLEFDPVGPGAAVGAGLGAISGALQGGGYDVNESKLIKQEEELDTLKLQNSINSQAIASLQNKIDTAQNTPTLAESTLLHTIYFDVDSTSMRSGSITNLEKIAETLKTNLNYYNLEIAGHTDDSGNSSYNKKLAEARARSVASYLASRGLSLNHLIVESYAAKRPITTNTTELGKQLNRRVEIYLKN